MELTILIPCLNEAQTLPSCVAKAKAFIERTSIVAEVLVSDNGSTDGSQELARSLGARVVDARERGYGAALITGIQAASGRFVIMGDGDDSYDFSQLEGFVDKLRQGADLVMGNRFKGGIAPGAMPPLHRYLGNPILSWLGRTFFRVNVGDFHCGLRGFSRDAMLRLGLVSPGMEFATEMVAKAALAGYSIREVPTTLSPDGRNRPPHLRTWRDGWRHLLFMLLFTPRWLFLIPGIFLAGGGFFGMAMLAGGPRTLGPMGLDVHSMLYFSAAVIIGAQLVQFALLVKWIAVVAGIVREPAWVTQARHHTSVEFGLIVGALVFFAGLAWSLALVSAWRTTGFSALDPQSTMRSVIPAVTMMALGVQAAASALLAGALQLAWKTSRNK
ncbi:MAG: glycosyltransferase family 2 protein [Comamonadaceae bacterium]|nr:glycosyltransferase family 2 protein [Comamonadaceae bacterium]